MGPTYNKLKDAAQSFCNDFTRKEGLEHILEHFSTSHQPSAIEHGEPTLAPFLGKIFTGTQGIKEYFETIRSVISYTGLRFSQFVVDTEMNRVSVKGQGEFTWKNTGESWNEAFIYMLDFDDDLKITEYQVWADSGSVYLARNGRLNEVRQTFAPRMASDLVQCD